MLVSRAQGRQAVSPAEDLKTLKKTQMKAGLLLIISRTRALSRDEKAPLEGFGPTVPLEGVRCPPEQLGTRCHPLCITRSSLGFAHLRAGSPCSSWSLETSGIHSSFMGEERRYRAPRAHCEQAGGLGAWDPIPRPHGVRLEAVGSLWNPGPQVPSADDDGTLPWRWRGEARALWMTWEHAHCQGNSGSWPTVC